MKIAVVGANGKNGRRVVLKAEENGINVVNLVEDAVNLVGSGPVRIKNFLDLDAKDLAGCHYVVDPISFWNIDSYSSELLPLWHLLEILKDSKTKLLVFGSPSFLYADSKRSSFTLDSLCGFIDDSSRQRAILSLNAFKRLKCCDNVKWSVLCPPLVLDELGYGSGRYEFGNDILPMGLDGDSSITVTDFISASIELLKLIPKDYSCISVRGLK